jgi:phage tail tape-measure protein
LLRKPITLLSDDTLEFFKGSLSRYRHSEAGHIGEEEVEVAHDAWSASERDETISEPGTPKQRPAALHPTKTPAQRSNVSHRSTLPSVNHSDGLALPTGTSIQSEVSELSRIVIVTAL